MTQDENLKQFGFIILFLVLVLVAMQTLGSKVTFYGLVVVFLSMLLGRWNTITAKLKNFSNI